MSSLMHEHKEGDRWRGSMADRELEETKTRPPLRTWHARPANAAAGPKGSMGSSHGTCDSPAGVDEAEGGKHGVGS